MWLDLFAIFNRESVTQPKIPCPSYLGTGSKERTFEVNERLATPFGITLPVPCFG